jgi:nitrate reductase cytochrome c-type subunit
MRTEMQKEKNKKLLMSLGFLVLVVIIAAFAVYKINANARAYELEQQEKQKYEEERLAVLEREQAEEAKRAEEEAVKEHAERIGFIDGIEYDTGLTPESTEGQVMGVMHKMTHQKVRAERKFGAIPMVEDTVNQVYDIVSNSNFAKKEKMLEIADRWKKGWFDKINSEHNFLWEQQEGSVGKAYGVLSSAEEKEFVRKNFPQYIRE